MTSLVAIPLFAIFGLLGPTIFAVVFGDEWRESGEYALLMCLMFAFQFVASPLSAIFTVAEKLAHRHSLCFGLIDGAAQVGLARVVTDYATFGYLCDVYVLESPRGKGLGRWLIECVMAHPQLQGLRRLNLSTRDAHSLYAGFGFRPLRNPESRMERHKPDIYKTAIASEQSAGPE